MVAFGFLAGAAFRLWCGFWFSVVDMFLLSRRFWVSAADRLWLFSKYFGGAAGGNSNASTAAQQGAAPDRLQLRSFLAALPAAGELGRCVAASLALLIRTS